MWTSPRACKCEVSVYTAKVDCKSTKEGKPSPVEKKAKGAAAAEEPKFEMAIQYKKDVDFPGWYTDVLLKGQMLDYYDISGCYILRPWSYSVWQTIQST